MQIINLCVCMHECMYVHTHMWMLLRRGNDDNFIREILNADAYHHHHQQQQQPNKKLKETQISNLTTSTCVNVYEREYRGKKPIFVFERV